VQVEWDEGFATYISPEPYAGIHEGIGKRIEL
jgi:hypothetical protein